MSMKTQFDNPLELSSDRRTITATGPLEWGPGAAPHCRISVVLMQGSVSGSGDTGNYNHGDATWDCDVRAANGAQWQTGPLVSCVGTVTMSAPPPADPWPPQAVSLQLELKPAAAPA
jgi:hypothetical protein